MQKIPVILVALNPNQINNALMTLNFNNAELLAIVAETNQPTSLVQYGDMKIPMYSFSSIEEMMNLGKNFYWLISGFPIIPGDIYKMKKFLIAGGIADDHIVSFYVLGNIFPYWTANIRYIEKNPADYFATGISYMEVGLNFQIILKGGGVGVNLSCSNQDLRQGYLTAKYVFKHTKKGSIKIVFIGLTPYSLRYDNLKAFSVCQKNLQYIWALKNSVDETTHGKLLQLLVSDTIKNYFMSLTDENADLNFDEIRKFKDRQFPTVHLVNWRDELKNQTKKFFPETVKQNLQILEDYIKLCIENGAKPVGVVFPLAPIIHDNYDQEMLTSFRLAMNQVEKDYDFKLIDLFDLHLDYSHFCNMGHLNLKGANASSSVLTANLYMQNFFPLENLCKYNYEFFYTLSQHIPKDDYNDLMDKVFKISVEKIRQKDKIRVAFVLYDASMWCGDDMYNLFAQNERYEVKIFLCLRQDKNDNETVIKDFRRGVEQFQNAGLNVIAVEDSNAEIPTQDLLIFLEPYLEVFPKSFQLENITAETLLVTIPYGFYLSQSKISNLPLINCLWKFFFETEFNLEQHKKECAVGMSRGYYSGYPRLDKFFKPNAQFNFEWKMAVPNPIKIIWAPHWSINEGVKFSTFQWNYQFMYELAEQYPQISWVVKPHPNLMFSAVEAGVFPNAEAFEEYLQKWDDLPNAKVVTGAYYHDIFATSDGIISDSGSFIAEYQYTHKPLIFLTRDTQKFNDLFAELMKCLYLVDGKDFSGIVKLIQKIFVNRNDDMFSARKNFFDKYFDYVKKNGMLSSEFIFKNIDAEFNP